MNLNDFFKFEIKFINYKIARNMNNVIFPIKPSDYNYILDILLKKNDFKNIFFLLISLYENKKEKFLTEIPVSNYVLSFLSQYKNTKSNDNIESLIKLSKLDTIHNLSKYISDFLTKEREYFISKKTSNLFNELFMNDNNSLMVKLLPNFYSLKNNIKGMNFLKETYDGKDKYEYYLFNLKNFTIINSLSIEKILIDIAKYFEQSFDKENHANILKLKKELEKENYLLYLYTIDKFKYFDLEKKKSARLINQLRNKIAHFDLNEKVNLDDTSNIIETLETNIYAIKFFFESLRCYISNYTFPILENIEKSLDFDCSLDNLSNDIILFYKSYIEKFCEDILKENKIIDIPNILSKKYYGIGFEKLTDLLDELGINFLKNGNNQNQIIIQKHNVKDSTCVYTYLMEHYNKIKGNYDNRNT